LRQFERWDECVCGWPVLGKGTLCEGCEDDETPDVNPSR